MPALSGDNYESRAQAPDATDTVHSGSRQKHKRKPGQIHGPLEGPGICPGEYCSQLGTSVLPLELELRSDLQDARFNCGSVNEAEGYICRSCVGAGEFDPIEEIVGIRPELQVVLFVDWDLLGKREVHRLLSRIPNG